MGYYVRANCLPFRMKKKNFDEAYRLMCELNNLPDSEKRGGGNNERWFSWMDANYPETCADFLAILDALGFHPEFDKLTGDIVDLEYDSKIGQEDLFFRAIGHLVEPNSFIYWEGEDGEKWRWVFDGKGMSTQHGLVTYA